MIKPDKWIKEFGRNGGIIPFNEDQVNPASYDVTLGNHWIIMDGSIERETTCSNIMLEPGMVVLATTKEYVKVPRNICCDLKLKSTIGRSWINHSLSGWVDPNFMGELTLELQNIGPKPVVLRENMRIAQLVFLTMEEEPETAYGEKGTGKYQYQQGATRARDQ
jgi:dCTP deaminase